MTRQTNNQLRGKRLSVGLTQQELAKQAGLTRQAVVAIEAGQYVPNTLVALRLARSLGCSVEELFHLPDELPRVEAELLTRSPDVSLDPSEHPARVQVGRVGERLLARSLVGDTGPFTPADGLIVSGSRVGGRINIDLLVDPRLIENTAIVMGCDPALTLLGAHLTRRYPSLRLIWIQGGSRAALQALARGEAHAAGTHLWDPVESEYNLPYIRRELAGQELIVVTLSQWQQGLIVRKGNPKGIAGFADLLRPDITIANREAGSGSRTLLDLRLTEVGAAPEQVRGYSRELPSHLAVAEAVASGAADAGPGILAIARSLGLGFVPLQEERYDLVIPVAYLNTPPLQALLEIAVSPALRAEVEALGGYDHSKAGTIAAEFRS